MLTDSVPFDEGWRLLRKDSIWQRALTSFLRFVEHRLGVRVVYDIRSIPYGHTDLLDLFEIAEGLKEAHIIRTYGFVHALPDEPRAFQWFAEIEGRQESRSGGFSLESARAALTATLAEGLERHLWHGATDYFAYGTYATATDIARRGTTLLPEQFSGFSTEQRAAHPRLTLSPNARYLWIRGRSWTTRSDVWLPAQVVSGKHGGHNMRHGDEPIILEPITTGLATGPTREFAILNGALEVIERDAFMITWLNQLTPPHIDLQALASGSPSVAELLHQCERYGLSLTAALLPTDAPAYAVCAIVTDTRGHAPQRTIGLKAHRDLARAVLGAAHEALRMRQNTRWHLTKNSFGTEKVGSSIVHTERLVYWALGERNSMLDFLVSGKSITPHEKWEHDTEAEHLERIQKWCAKNHYAFVSVPLAEPSQAISPWYVEMVVIPELLPLHQNETYRYAGGMRRETVPRMFGYSPRAQPFFDEPHPFA